MNRDLVTALEERIREGYTEASIIEEMVAVGYTKDEATRAYATAVISTSNTSPEAGLPTIGSFLSETWRLCTAELTLLGKSLLLGVGTFVGVAITVFVIAHTLGFSVQGSFLATTIIVPLLALLLGAILSFALTRALLLRTNGVLFRDHVIFAFKNFFSLALITLYVTIITQVGYALFIIPGIMAAVYLLFTVPHALTKESRGLAALVGSIALVYGRFFPVLGRVVVMNLIIVAIGSIFMLIIGGLSVGAVVYDPNLGFVGMPLFMTTIIGSVIASVYWLTCGLVVLYETLSRVPAPVVPSVQLRTRLKTLLGIIIGVVIGIITLIVFAVSFVGYAFLNW